MGDLKTQFLLHLILLITTHTERLTHKKASSGNLLERMLDGGNRQYGIIKGGFPVIMTTERILTPAIKFTLINAYQDPNKESLV